MNLVHLTEENFNEEVIKSELPVLIDFWAEWCGPCKRVAPVVEEIAKEYSGKIKVAKLDVDEAPNVAGKYGIMSIPTLIIFKNGKAIEQVVGYLNKSELKTKIEENL